MLAQLPGSAAGSVECTVDLADNHLRQAGTLAKMLQSLRETSLHVTVLRLYKNRYDDSVAVPLAEHIRAAATQGRPLMQLHLSNNSLTEAGMRLLIEAAHHSKGYPRSMGCAKLKSLGQDSGRRVLWLRVENQDPPIARPRDFLESCSAVGLPVCILTEGSGQKPPADAVVQMHEYFLSAPFAKSSGKGSSGRAKGLDPNSSMSMDGLHTKSGKGKGKCETLFTTASGISYKVVERGDGVMCIQACGVGMDDADLEELAPEMDRILAQLPGSAAGTVECTVDLAGNHLHQAGTLSKMLQSLRETSLHVTVLRLYKNRYDDSVAVPLAEHIRAAATQGRPLMQLHLSNNSLTEAGMRLLIEAAHHSKGYPRSMGCAKLKSLGQDSGRRVLWLRVENQDPPIARPRDFLESCSAVGLPVCILTEGSGQKPPADAVVQMHEYFLSAHFAKSSGKGSSGRAKGLDPNSSMSMDGLHTKSGKGKGKCETLFTTASGISYKVVERGDGVMCIQACGVGMDDADLEELAQEMDRILAQFPGSAAGTVECTLDLADNHLQHAGTLSKMLQSLRETSLHVTVLRLYKNRYDDSAAVPLAEHIRAAATQGRPLMQLHLSNNSLTEAGMRLLIEAAHHSKGYPRSMGCAKLKSLGQDSGRRVLWLRVENQDSPIAGPRDFLESCSSVGLPVWILGDGSGQKPPADAVVQIHPSFVRTHDGGRLSCLCVFACSLPLSLSPPLPSRSLVSRLARFPYASDDLGPCAVFDRLIPLIPVSD